MGNFRGCTKIVVIFAEIFAFPYTMYWLSKKLSGICALTFHETFSTSKNFTGISHMHIFTHVLQKYVLWSLLSGSLPPSLDNLQLYFMPLSDALTHRGIICTIPNNRVPECLSFRPNWLPPSPLPQASVPPRNQRGGQHAGEGAGGANSNDWRKSLVLCTLCFNLPPLSSPPPPLYAHCTRHYRAWYAEYLVISCILSG